jgi:hypothetical protein
VKSQIVRISGNVGRYSVDQFVESTGQKDLGEGKFELERDRLLEVNLDGRVWIKKGTMEAYNGILSSQEKESWNTALANW